jgi:regulator of replication initiation timing
MTPLLEKKVAVLRGVFGRKTFYRELFQYIDELRAEMALLARGKVAAPVAQLQEEHKALTAENKKLRAALGVKMQSESAAFYRG